MELVTIFFLAFIPALIYVVIIYWLDRYEKEPKILIGVVFLWGALIAAGAAYVLNTIFGVSVYLLTSSEYLSEIATGTLSAPLVEETLKGLAVLIVFFVFRKEFDSLLDGIVYASVTALGFAATENVLYMWEMGYLEDGWEGVIFIFFLRVVFGAWNHATYTAFTGIGLAISRLSNAKFTIYAAPILGWGIAIFTHFLHNLIASFATGTFGVIALFGTDWLGWLFMMVLIFWANSQEKKLLQVELKSEMESGLINLSQYTSATSYVERAKILFPRLLNGKYKKANKFYLLCSELAHKKSQYRKLGDGKGNSMVLIESLRTKITLLQNEF